MCHLLLYSFAAAASARRETPTAGKTAPDVCGAGTASAALLSAISAAISVDVVAAVVPRADPVVAGVLKVINRVSARLK